jgi:hypothetical protein
MNPRFIAIIAVTIATAALNPAALSAAGLRLGMIGLDTSHVPAFTKLLNDPTDKEYVLGGTVVAAIKGGSPDIESSIRRVDSYTVQLQDKFGVKIVATVEELCQQVDAVLIMSVDGRPHLEYARQVIKSGKPLYIDKPIAGSLRDALEIFRLAKESKVPVFSSSSYRYYPGLVALQKTNVGGIKAVISYGPATLEPHHPDLFWYGVHPTEALFTMMGTGCVTVVRSATPDIDVVTGTWSDGRVGTLQGIRNAAAPNKVIVFGTKAVAEQAPGGNYTPLVREIIKFFQTGVSPVPPEETMELFAFMEAADESKRQNGAPVKIKDVLSKNSQPQPATK